MTNRGLFSTNDFAAFSRLTRHTLLHYDKIGLLSPAARGENNYRYYSAKQLAFVNVIRTLQKFGLSLAEIKTLKDGRTPESTEQLLSRQIEEIDKRIEEWRHARKLLSTLQETIQSVAGVDEKAIVVQSMPAMPIVLGGLNDYSGGRNDDDALLSFYREMRGRYPDVDLDYSAWAVFSRERIERGDWFMPDRYYLNNPEGRDAKPAALYAIGYTRGGYGECDELYRRLIGYIDENGFEICGDAYEEYPVNEICTDEDRNYLIRVMIVVRPKNGAEA